MKPVRPILAAAVVALVGIGCGPPAPATPVTVGEDRTDGLHHDWRSRAAAE